MELGGKNPEVKPHYYFVVRGAYIDVGRFFLTDL